MASGFDSDVNKTPNMTLEQTKKHLKSSDIVLDYGCATGTIAIEISDKVNKVYGIDISGKMIEAAKKRATEDGIINIDFLHTSIFDDRFPKESFDKILAFNILHLLEDTEKVLNRFNELLRPGGLFISSTACMEKRSFTNILILLISKIGIIPYVKLFKVNELERLIVNGSFKIVEKVCLDQSTQQYFIIARKL